MLALGAQRGLYGHLGLAGQGAPVVLPVNYAVDDADIFLRVGDGLWEAIAAHNLVAFEVDGVENGQLWSVLVRGYATEIDRLPATVLPPEPLVAHPGNRLVRISGDVETGRRLLPM